MASADTHWRSPLMSFCLVASARDWRDDRHQLRVSVYVIEAQYTINIDIGRIEGPIIPADTAADRHPQRLPGAAQPSPISRRISAVCSPSRGAGRSAAIGAPPIGIGVRTPAMA